MSLEIYSEIKKTIEQRRKAVLCIIIETKGSTPRKKASKMLVFEDKSIVGSIGGGELEHFVVQKAVERIDVKEANVFSFGLKADFEMACGGNVSVYMETIQLPEHLIVFGGGHIGKSLALFAKKLNFNITIVDERENIFDNWNINDGFNLINKSYQEAIDQLVFDKDTYICAATHAHSYDKEIAGIICSKQLAYFGIIASKNKAIKIKKFLLSKKDLKIEDIEKIDMPMGVPISCETPEEIAISVLAKIIDVRNNK